MTINLDRSLNVILTEIDSRLDAAEAAVGQRPTLVALGLASPQVLENIAQGAVISGITNATSGSTLAIDTSDNAGGRIAVSGSNIVRGATGIDYEGSSVKSLTFSVIETLTNATNSPRKTQFTVPITNVFEQPSLKAIKLSTTAFTSSAASTFSLIDVVTGAAVSYGALPAGMTIDAAARTGSYDGRGTVFDGNIAFTQVLADSPNDGLQNAVAVTIGGAAQTAVTAAPAARSTTLADNAQDSGIFDTGGAEREVTLVVGNTGGYITIWFGDTADDATRVRVQIGNAGTNTFINMNYSGGQANGPTNLNLSGKAIRVEQANGSLTVYDGQTVLMTRASVPSFGTGVRVSRDIGASTGTTISSLAKPVLVRSHEFDINGRWVAVIAYAGAPGSITYTLNGVTGVASVLSNPTPGAATISIPVPVSVPLLDTVRLAHTSDATKYADQVIMRPPTPIVGVNEANVYGIADFNDLFIARNRLAQSKMLVGRGGNDKAGVPHLSWSTATGDETPWKSMATGSDNEIIRAYGTTASGKANTEIDFYLPYWWPAGTYDLVTPPGMTVVVGSIPYDAGTKKMTVSADQRFGTQPLVRLSGTIPAAGIDLRTNFGIYEAGDTNRNLLVSDRAIASLADLGVTSLRNMDMQAINGVNGQLKTRDDWIYRPAGNGEITPFEIQMEEWKRYGGDFWHCTALRETQGSLDYEADRLIEVMVANPTAKLTVEVSNEVWNGAFATQYEAGYQGALLGYWNDAGNYGPTTFAGTLNYDGKTTTAAPQGSLFWARNIGGLGMGVWRTKRAITSNDIAANLDSGNNAWELLSDNNGCRRASHRYLSDRTKIVGQRFIDKMATAGVARSRLDLTFAWQTDGVADTISALNWGNLGAMLDSVSFGWYWGTSAGHSIGIYEAFMPGWTATEKALLGTDIPAFKTAFFNYANKVQDDTIKEVISCKLRILQHVKAAWNRTIQYHAYEIAQHWGTSGNWAATGGDIDTVWPQMAMDQRMGDAELRWGRMWVRQIGGKYMHYCRGGFTPSTGNKNAWGIQRNESDRTAPRYQAIKTLAAEVKARRLAMA